MPFVAHGGTGYAVDLRARLHIAEEAECGSHQRGEGHAEEYHPIGGGRCKQSGRSFCVPGDFLRARDPSTFIYMWS